ncbi:MAG: hypothetical protein JWN00_6003 [Actinomycetia bacterium]|nr:hypothetical protein [Actinomycetes bacterium]
MTTMTAPGTVPERQIRALFTEGTVTVYQAYSPEIADRALAAGTFVPPFRLGRMTWIKPSFLWMMHRSGWATKPGQERVLAIQITRGGFEWALSHAALSHYEPGTYASQQQWADRKLASPVRIQWDPERSLLLQSLPWRSIQIGLSGQAATKYIREWITSLADITAATHEIRDLVAAGDLTAARTKLPAERPYPLPTSLQTAIGAG